MNLFFKQNAIKYAIVNAEGKVLEKFRIKQTADNFLRQKYKNQDVHIKKL